MQLSTAWVVETRNHGGGTLVVNLGYPHGCLAYRGEGYRGQYVAVDLSSWGAQQVKKRHTPSGGQLEGQSEERLGKQGKVGPSLLCHRILEVQCCGNGELISWRD